MKKIMVFMLALTTVFVSSSAFAVESVIIHNAWVRSAPPNAKVLAAYMTITNHSEKPIALTAVSSSQFGKIEMHKTEMHGDTMKMIHQKKLNIPAKGSQTLKPGGYHLMLMKPKSVPQVGESVDMKLHFDNGQLLHIKVPVRADYDKGT
jgi:copper(I)-binding protein